MSALVRLDRIGLDRNLYDWLRDVMSADRITLAPLTPQAAAGAGALPAGDFLGDPADRFLYAQARELAVILITKDRRLRDYAQRKGEIRAVW